MREDSAQDVGAADVFPLALGERVRVREDSERDAVPDGCPFGHGYKEGSVWNRPLRYFSQPRDVGDVDVFPLALLSIAGRSLPAIVGLCLPLMIG